MRALLGGFVLVDASSSLFGSLVLRLMDDFTGSFPYLSTFSTVSCSNKHAVALCLLIAALQISVHESLHKSCLDFLETRRTPSFARHPFSLTVVRRTRNHLEKKERKSFFDLGIIGKLPHVVACRLVILFIE